MTSFFVADIAPETARDDILPIVMQRMLNRECTPSSSLFRHLRVRMGC